MYKQTFLALLYLHADKAKDLQINLSEALQGNIQFLLLVLHSHDVDMIWHKFPSHAQINILLQFVWNIKMIFIQYIPNPHVIYFLWIMSAILHDLVILMDGDGLELRNWSYENMCFLLTWTFE